MRRLTIALCAALIALAGCRRGERTKIELVDDSAPTLASVVHVADPRSSVQLIKGFHDIEQNAWRWTMGRFSVTLRPPRGSAEKGAILRLRFSLPEAVIERLKAVSISANVSGTGIPAQSFQTAGDHVFSHPVPASALTSDAVAVEFALDKYLPPGAVDQRELGVVVSSVGLETK